MVFKGFGAKYSPLSDRFTPNTLQEIRGQEHATSIIRGLLKSKRPFNLLFYGPPGTGKTQVAKLLAAEFNIPSIKVNACRLSQGEWKKLVLKVTRENVGSTILILDEVHRLNKLQQEFLLPYLETGEIYLIGITSENPFYTLSKALLSRVLPIEFKKLSKEAIWDILKKAIKDREKGLGRFEISISDDMLFHIAEMSDGDARRALNYIEALVMGKEPPVKISWDDVKSLGIAKPSLSKSDFYDLVSAFIKSMRKGDREATVYYLGRLLKGGVSYRYILRRMLIFAAEDIGLANPMAISVVAAGYEGFEKTGEAEGKIILSMIAQYLALSKKSNDAILYLKRVEKTIDKGLLEEVPGFLRYGERKTERYINPHIDSKKAQNQKYISDKLRDIIQGKEV